MLRPTSITRRSRFPWFMRRGLLAIAAILVLGAALSTGAPSRVPGDSEVEARIKAAFVYNFARFVEWPAPASSGPVRIAVLGNGDLASPLAEVIRGKTANGRPIQFLHLKKVAEANCCEILLIERSESKRVREIVQALAGKPILTVCDEGDGFRDGAMIVFQFLDDSVRFRINRQAAEKAGLKISSQLLKVAIPAEGKHP